MSDKNSEPNPIGSRVILATLLAILLIGGLGGWAMTAQLSGAVIAQGQVVVDQQIKAVQHPDGGIVSAILIREGDEVAEGQVILRLDETQTRAELSIIESQLLELVVRRARLVAERDQKAAIDFPPELDLSQPVVAALVKGEQRLFAGHTANRESRKRQLELVVSQIKDEIHGLEAQLRSKDEESVLVEEHRTKLEYLVAQKLMEHTPLYAVKREVARLSGERGEVSAAIARAKTKVNEISLQILDIDENARTEAQRELTALDTKLSELTDRQLAISDRLSRTEIRSPIAGTIHELNVHTIGGVITPAEVLTTIVPMDAHLAIEVMLPPTSIDQVEIGSPARLRLPALNQRTTPELKGEITHVSPATSQDHNSGQYFYRAEVSLGEGEVVKLGESKLIPGMPVEVYVTTSERTALSYFIKPITDQLGKAFRER